MKKMTAKQKPAKGKPREWNGYAVVSQFGKLVRTFRTKTGARTWAFSCDGIIRVRITEIVK